MKSPEQRGPFASWLRDQRTARFKTTLEASDALRRSQRYGIAKSTWAEMESGTRLPNDEQRDKLAAFFNADPPRVWPEPAEDGDVIAAIREQTAAITALVEEMRLAREAASERDVVQARFLEGLARQSAAGVSEEQSEFGALPKGQE